MFSLALGSCSSKCLHLQKTEAVIQPTHEAEGYTVVSCTNCSYEYSTDFVPPLGHSMQTQVFAPTCTDEGYTRSFCECGYEFNSEQAAPLGHTLSLQTIEPTCESEGYTVATCTVCSESYKTNIISPLGHELKLNNGFVSINTPSATSSYSCERCNLDYVGDYLYYNEVYQGAYVDNTTVLCKGIDVSYYNHDKAGDSTYLPLNWKKIKEQGYSFVILRVGYMGSQGSFVTDPVFEMDYAAAKEAGLGVGAYVYSYAYTPEDAQTEALAVIQAISGKQFEYPIYFDVEDQKILDKDISPLTLTYICKEFISTMQENGYFAALYTNNDWLTEYFVSDRVTAEVDIWYARYESDSKTINEGQWKQEWGKQMPMWQFSMTGTIEGINRVFEKDSEGNPKPVTFDLNYCYKDYPTIIKKFGLNGFTIPTPPTQ